jgi:hypothetical protein
MASDRSSPASRPLTRCSACGCGLVYPLAVRTGPDGQAVITRRCPECEFVDVVVCGAVAAVVWLRREAEIRAQLTASLPA